MGLFIPGNPHDLGSGERTLTFAFKASRCTLASIHKAWAGRQQGPHPRQGATRHRHRVGPFPKAHWGALGLPAQMQHKIWKCTYCKAQTRQVGVSLLQPVVEILGIIRGIPLSIGGHAEHSQGLVNLREATQVRLQAEERRNPQGSHAEAVGQLPFPQWRCVNSTTRLQEGLGKAKPTQNKGEIKTSTLTGLQVSISTPPEKQWDFPCKALRDQEDVARQGPSPNVHRSG